MANVIQSPVVATATTGNTQSAQRSKTRKFKFSPVPVPTNLPDKQNQAGDAIDVVIVQQ
jgi:hypothetical protein